MRKITAFYAWQSDTPGKFNRDLINIALEQAATRINQDTALDVQLLIDSDTQGVPGIPPITETILRKIESSNIFVPDVTFVAHTEEGTLVPNPNVMIEFGYALRTMTHAGILPVMNTAFGPPEELPFDMGHLRYPIQYSIQPTANNTERREVREALSRAIEQKLRLQIKVTQPLKTAPAPFPRVQPKDGPARFRVPGQPLGKVWDDLPRGSGLRQGVSFTAGPAMWLRLMPVADPGGTWPVLELKKHAIGSGQFHLAPFRWQQIFMLRAEDGFGLCDLSSPDQTDTASVAFAFETGEIWSIDTTLLRFDPNGLIIEDIQTLFADRLQTYANLLANLGLDPPYRWIAGISGANGRRLRIPAGRPHATVVGPECLSENIVAEGMYATSEKPIVALSPFFNAIFDKSGAPRPNHIA